MTAPARQSLQIADLENLIHGVRGIREDIAIVVLAEDAHMAQERPALHSVRFLERIDHMNELSRMERIYMENGFYCRVVFGVSRFLEMAVAQNLFPEWAKIKIVIDRTEGGGHRDGFGPARRSLGALLCKQFGFHYGHADAYSAAITRHKHHQALIMHAAGIPAPATWSYDVRLGWVTGLPPKGLKVIAKSTFEAWSIGVSEDTVGPFSPAIQEKIQGLAEELGQPICVQEFIEGREIYALVLDIESPAVAGLVEARSSEGPKPNGDYLVFEDHRRPGGIIYEKCNDLPADTVDSLKTATVETFRLLGMTAYGRIDFRVDNAGKPFVMDIADNPGTSPASSLTRILGDCGVDLQDIPILLLAVSLRASRLL